MQRLVCWHENIAIDKRAAHEVVSDPVPFRTIEVDREEGKPMLQAQKLFEVLVALIHGLDLVKSLRKSSESVIWLLLAVHVVNDVVNRLDNVLVVRLRLRYGYFLCSVGQITIRGIDICHPTFVRWFDSALYEVLYGRNGGVARSFDECEFAEVAHSVDEILHLIHHNFAVVIVAM